MFKLDSETEWISEKEFDRPNVPFAMRVDQEIKQRIRAAMAAQHAKEKLDAEEAIKSRVLERKQIEAERFEEAVQRCMANM
jgi:ATP-dependent Zn protease